MKALKVLMANHFRHVKRSNFVQQSEVPFFYTRSLVSSIAANTKPFLCILFFESTLINAVCDSIPLLSHSEDMFFATEYLITFYSRNVFIKSSLIFYDNLDQ